MSDDVTDGAHADLGDVLESLINVATVLRPDDVPDAVRRHAADLGLHNATLYLVDKEQKLLLPFPPGPDPLGVDSTMAGLAYRRSMVIGGDVGDGVQLWIPLLDGSHRVGVLGARVKTHDEATARSGLRLAGLVAELLIAKSNYGDNILIAMRRHPLSLAAEMRWELLPPLTFLGTEVAIAGYLEPAYDIAGDAFDYAVNGDTAHVAIFDARGHGLTASRIANLALMTYRHSRRVGGGLEATYQAIDHVIAAEMGEESFATAQLARLDTVTGELRWVNAGHPPPLLLRGGRTAQELPAVADVPVGLEGPVPAVNEAQMEPGDVVALYSDGITEARSVDGEAFGVERLADFLIRASAADELLPETVRRLVHAIIERQGGSVADDATVVLLEWRP